MRYFLLLILITSSLYADSIYWYNGDPEQPRYQLSNNVSNNDSGRYMVYDNFSVLDGGVQVSGLFGSFISSPNAAIQQVEWQIRSGMSHGNGGALVASGTETSFTQESRNFGDLPAIPQFRLFLEGLNFFLTAGDYWLGMSVKGTTGDATFSVLSTDGTNAVETPQVNDGNIIVDAALANGFNYSYMQYKAIGLSFLDREVSYGILTPDAAPVPEPGTLGIVTVALLCIGGGRLARRLHARKA